MRVYLLEGIFLEGIIKQLTRCSYLGDRDRSLDEMALLFPSLFVIFSLLFMAHHKTDNILNRVGKTFICELMKR